MRLEIYRPDTTVVIFGDIPMQIERFGAALAEGPVVLAELATHGFFFGSQCITNPNYCVASPVDEG